MGNNMCVGRRKQNLLVNFSAVLAYYKVSTQLINYLKFPLLELSKEMLCSFSRARNESQGTSEIVLSPVCMEIY